MHRPSRQRIGSRNGRPPAVALAKFMSKPIDINIGLVFDDNLRDGMNIGRRMHREQITEVFAPQLAARPAAQQEALVDLLVVATDVYIWKLLRRDRGLDRTATEERVRQLIARILED
jgi:hypothetical protein